KQILVFPEGRIDKVVQDRITELPPPDGVGQGLGFALLPPPGGRNVQAGSDIVGAEGAAGAKGDHHKNKHEFTHWAPPWLPRPQGTGCRARPPGQAVVSSRRFSPPRSRTRG